MDIAGARRLRDEEPFATAEAMAPYIGKEIDLLYELPLIQEQISGVYFMFEGPVLVYVGASGGIANRLNHYFREKRHRRPMGWWTHIGVLPVPDEIKFTVEDWYIQKHRPVFNFRRPLRSRR